MHRNVNVSFSQNTLKTITDNNRCLVLDFIINTLTLPVADPGFPMGGGGGGGRGFSEPNFADSGDAASLRNFLKQI